MRPHIRLTLWGAILTTMTIFATAGASVGLVEGVATAKDGDDVIVQGIDMRLQGIAAPEDNGRQRQPGGPEATANLKKLVEGKNIACMPDGTRARGRPSSPARSAA